jgi:hypothetical protein
MLFVDIFHTSIMGKGLYWKQLERKHSLGQSCTACKEDVYKPTVIRYPIGCLKNEHNQYCIDATRNPSVRRADHLLYPPDPQNLHVLLDAFSTKASVEWSINKISRIHVNHQCSVSGSEHSSHSIKELIIATFPWLMPKNDSNVRKDFGVLSRYLQN